MGLYRIRGGAACLFSRFACELGLSRSRFAMVWVLLRVRWFRFIRSVVRRLVLGEAVEISQIAQTKTRCLEHFALFLLVAGVCDPKLEPAGPRERR